MSIIEQIKAEVERQMENARNVRINGTTQQAKEADAIIHTLQDHLNFLSTLQEQPVSPPNWYPNPLEEQPVCEGFDREFSKFSNDVDAEHPFPICVDEYKDFARHFYELGRQSKEQPVCEELEDAVTNYIAPIENEDGLKVINFSGQDIKDAFVAGANWQREQNDKETAELLTIAHLQGADQMREQMMKEAVEGEVCGRVYDHINIRFADGICKFLEPKNISHIPADVSKYKVGDKVRIIIVKEN